MTKYAKYDSTAPAPQVVQGWYNADRHDYKVMPHEDNLLELTEEQWEMTRADPNRWAVNNGVLEDWVHPSVIEAGDEPQGNIFQMIKSIAKENTELKARLAALESNVKS